MKPQGVSLSLEISIWWRRLQAMTVKEFIQLFRDPILLFFILYAFTADIFLAGSGVTLQLNHSMMVVHDADHSIASRELIHRFRPPYFRLDGEIAYAKDGIRLLDQGKAMIVLDIPPGFQESLLKGEPTAVQMQVDTTNVVLGFLATNYGAQIVSRYGLETGLAHEGLISGNSQSVPMVINDSRVWFNPNQEDSWFMSITELLNIITLFAILLPATAMAREKERGTVEQLLVSPLTPFQIMFPKVIAMTAVILVGTVLSLFAILRPIFLVPFKGAPILFFTITVLYIFTTTGLGLFISTIARNLAQVGMLTLLIFTPMSFLSGAWTPPEAMPKFLLIMMAVSPLHYYIDASFGILLKGAGLDILWDSVIGIALLGGVLFGFGMWRFRRQFE
jgi:ABC-2 type transport system permease protein